MIRLVAFSDYMVEPEPIYNFVANKSCPPEVLDTTHNLSNRPRRLAVTRGFNNEGLSQIRRASSTPLNREPEIFPVARSTPSSSPKPNNRRVLQQKLLGINSLVGSHLSKAGASPLPLVLSYPKEILLLILLYHLVKGLQLLQGKLLLLL